MKKMEKGQRICGQEVLDTEDLSNGWQISKWTGKKGPDDFVVKLRSDEHPIGFAVKHAHFAVDFYGKLCQSGEKGLLLLEIIIDVWHHGDVDVIIQKHQDEFDNMMGYPFEYYIKALDWILEQEDVNFSGRPADKQAELDRKLKYYGFSVPSGRSGGQLAVALFCDIARGVHPVEALYAAGLSIKPR